MIQPGKNPTGKTGFEPGSAALESEDLPLSHRGGRGHNPVEKQEKLLTQQGRGVGEGAIGCVLSISQG